MPRLNKQIVYNQIYLLKNYMTIICFMHTFANVQAKRVLLNSRDVYLHVIAHYFKDAYNIGVVSL